MTQSAPSPVRERARGALLLLPVIFWGTAFIFQEAVQQSPWRAFPCFSGVARFAISALMVGLILLVANKGSSLKKAHAISRGVIVGGFIGAMSVCQTKAIYLVGAGATNVSFITSMNLVFVPFISAGFGMQRLDRIHLFAIVVAVAGLACLASGTYGKVSESDLWAIGGAFFLAVDTVLICKFAANVEKLPFMFWQFVTAGAVMFILAVAAEPITKLPPIDRPFAGSIIALTLFATIIAYYIQIYAQEKVPPIDAAIIFTAEPVVTLVAKWIWSAEYPKLLAFVGCALILASGLVVEVAQARKAR